MASDPLDSRELQRLQNFVYLVPILGFFPAVWTLYQRQGTREQRSLCRTSALLTLTWIAGYVLCSTGAQSLTSLHLTLMILNSVLTSGYFVASLWLMMRLWQRQPVELPGIGQKGDRPAQKSRVRLR